MLSYGQFLTFFYSTKKGDVLGGGDLKLIAAIGAWAAGNFTQYLAQLLLY